MPGRPDWFFVKLHAHGAPEHDHATLLGEPMVRFHEDLAALARDNPKFHYHYVTAREMANLIKAAQGGISRAGRGGARLGDDSKRAAHEVSGLPWPLTKCAAPQSSSPSRRRNDTVGR